ncbi:bifunctional nuclease family protein [Chlamydiota bacterium]
MKEVKIFSLLFFPPANQFVVTLVEESESRIIPIWIGIAEGNALHIKMKNIETPRPLTHDLLGSILDTAQFSIKRIVINDLKNSTYFASIELSSKRKKYSIDARPSDALVLAVGKNIPIFIRENVLKQCPVIPKPISQKDVDTFKEEMINMSPEDFFKKLEKGE